MVLSKLSFKIGTKLGLMSGMGIVLVLGLIGAVMYGNSHVRASNEAASFQNTVALAAAEMKASVRGMQVGVRDMRLATTPDGVQTSTSYIQARHASVNKFIDPVIGKVRPENRERMEKIKSQADLYQNVAREIATTKGEIFALEAKRSDADASRIASLNEQVARVARERGLPLAREMEEHLTKIGEVAHKAKLDAEANAVSEMASSERISMLVGGLAVLLLIGSAIFGAISIARPLANMVPVLRQIADGDFNVVIPNRNRQDEIGMIANAAEMVADRVGSTIVNIKMSASEVTNASAEISTSTTDLSQRTEEQAASLEETSASMEEMTSTVRKNADNAKQASELAGTTREVADRGGAVVAKTVEAMARIEESSRKISDIIIVIDEIARQTNLLALNAAVEAARAGDAGRGFAVVASEVRSLAQRSSQAAKDIKDLITNSTDQVKDGVDLVNRAGESLREIVESIKKVTVVVSEIANASMEQSTGIEQINKALTQMDEVTQQNSALVEENAATAKTLEQQAKSMDERVALFKVRPSYGVATQTASASVAVERPQVVAAPRHEASAPRRAAQPKRAAVRAVNHGSPVGRMQAGLAVALKNDADWQEF